MAHFGFRNWLRIGFVALALACGALTHAQSSPARAPEITFDEEAALLSADFNLTLGPALEDALARGVPLYFVVETEVVRERLLINDTVASKSETFRLVYVPLTRSYRVGSGLYNPSFQTLEAATRQFSRLRATRVAERKVLQKGERYVATARLRLDTNQLPKPLQLSALASREWSLDVDAVRVPFTP
jgi:Domain of unknown function (DUF4390)